MLGHFTSIVAILSAAYLAVQGFSYWWVFVVYSFLVSITSISASKDD